MICEPAKWRLSCRRKPMLHFISSARSRRRGRPRQECPKRGSLDGPVCTIVIDERWYEGLTGLAGHKRIQVLYWMHRARRDLVLQTPFQRPTMGTRNRPAY
jgi:tRNA (Thr-GGU) A37 N-methylase